MTESGTGRSPPPARIAGFLETELLGHVPHDEQMAAAQDAGVPVVTYASDSDAAAALRRRPGLLGMHAEKTGGFRFGDVTATDGGE